MGKPILLDYRPEGHYLNSTYRDCEIIGEGKVVVRGQFSLGNGVRLTGITLDGEGSTSNRVALIGNDITIDHCSIINCPANSFRAHYTASAININNCLFVGSKAFNTHDFWMGRDVIFSHNHVLEIPGEGFLIDQPANTPLYTGVVISNNTFSMAANGQRAVGLARCINVTVSNNVFQGPCSKDLFHLEDKTENVLVSGNNFWLNGGRACIDCSLGGDTTYTHTNRSPIDTFITGNMLYRGTGIGIEMQGREGLWFERLTITNNHIPGPGMAIDARTRNYVIENNYLYGGTIRIIS